MQEHSAAARMRVVVNRLQPAGVESAGASNYAMNFVIFGKEQFGQIGAILAGYPCNQRFLRHVSLTDSVSFRNEASLETSAERGHSCPQQFPNRQAASENPQGRAIRPTLQRTGMSALRFVVLSLNNCP